MYVVVIERGKGDWKKGEWLNVCGVGGGAVGYELLA